jgi:hypothetical protein
LAAGLFWRKEKVEDSAVFTIETFHFPHNLCQLMPAALCYFFFFFAAVFFFAAFFFLAIVCYLHMAPQTCLHTITENILNSPIELPKKQKVVAILSIVQIPENPSKKFLLMLFSASRESFMMINNDRKKDNFVWWYV